MADSGDGAWRTTLPSTWLLLQTFDGEVTDEILAELWELRLLGVEDLGVPAAT
jgi:hypothetical protein